MIALAGTFIGGLGLFLLAMTMITEGMRLSAGEGLRRLLANWTGTLPRQLLVGVGLTALVQSSSVVTVATIGFVNAGMMALGQALGVVYGANVGTTFTGWLVAAIGFKVNLEILALPLIGVGMGLAMLARGRRAGAVGSALAGFGLFFLGVSFLKDGFDQVAGMVDLGALARPGPWQDAVLVLIGTGLTVMTQASAAAIAITLSAVAGGLIGVEGAAAMVIGANVGTTSTALFATLAATPGARRVALAHVMFNLLTGLVALLLLGPLLRLAGALLSVLGEAATPAMAVAMFHTLFNLLGVALMLPLTGRLVAWLNRRYVRPEEEIGTPRFLDSTVRDVPELAAQALSRELGNLYDHVRALTRAALTRPEATGLDVRAAAIDRLILAIRDFAVGVRRNAMTAGLAEALPDMLRVTQYLERVTHLAWEVHAWRARLQASPPADPGEELDALFAAGADLVDACDPASPGFDADDAGQVHAAFEARYQHLKARMLTAGAERRITVHDLDVFLDQLSSLHRLADQALKSARWRTAIAARLAPA